MFKTTRGGHLEISPPTDLRYNDKRLLVNNRIVQINSELERHFNSDNSILKVKNLKQLSDIIDKSKGKDLVKFTINENKELFLGIIKDGYAIIHSGTEDQITNAIKSTNHSLLPFAESSSQSSLFAYTAGYIIGRDKSVFKASLHSGHYMPPPYSLGHLDALIRSWGGGGVVNVEGWNPYTIFNNNLS